MYVNSRVERSMSTKSRTLSISGTGFLSIKKKIISDFITIRTTIYYLPIYLPGLIFHTSVTLISKVPLHSRVYRPSHKGAFGLKTILCGIPTSIFRLFLPRHSHRGPSHGDLEQGSLVLTGLADKVSILSSYDTAKLSLPSSAF